MSESDEQLLARTVTDYRRAQSEHAELLTELHQIKQRMQEAHTRMRTAHTVANYIVGPDAPCPIHAQSDENQTPGTSQATNKRPKPGTAPAYVLEAIAGSCDGLSAEEIVEKMEELGWETDSADKLNRARTTLNKMAKSGTWVTKTDDGRFISIEEKLRSA